ncbi:MAG: tRNA (5-methylaminomethyl-2-thiouridine)(34)-methyltransferase MnmD, partial [Endozoicomonas sp.]
MSNSQSTPNQYSFLETATIQWEGGLPASTRFNDLYFSRVSGIDETRYVFLKHNQLTERFNAMKAGETFTIGETGFGTGLNFLCVWQLFLTHAPESTNLLFISTEKYPLQPKDLTRALSLFKELDSLIKELTNAYVLDPKNIALSFTDAGNHKSIQLNILIGDVVETLPTIKHSIDAWFLDGFSPAKNPDLWQPRLFEIIQEKR